MAANAGSRLTDPAEEMIYDEDSRLSDPAQQISVSAATVTPAGGVVSQQ